MIFPVAVSMVAVMRPPLAESCESGMVLDDSIEVLRDFEDRRRALPISTS
jgi:hypothetical protein